MLFTVLVIQAFCTDCNSEESLYLSCSNYDIKCYMKELKSYSRQHVRLQEQLNCKNIMSDLYFCTTTKCIRLLYRLFRYLLCSFSQIIFECHSNREEPNVVHEASGSPI